jgi:hypothetical protein
MFVVLFDPNFETNDDIESGTRTVTPTELNLNDINTPTNDINTPTNDINTPTNDSSYIPNLRTVNVTQTTTINTETGEVTTNNETDHINNLLNITDGMSSLISSITHGHGNENNGFDTNEENNQTNDTVDIIGSIVSRQINNLIPIMQRTNATIDNINVEVRAPTNETPSHIPRDNSNIPFPVQHFSIGNLNNIPIPQLNDNTLSNIFSNMSLHDFRQETEEQNDNNENDNNENENDNNENDNNENDNNENDNDNEEIETQSTTSDDDTQYDEHSV